VLGWADVAAYCRDMEAHQREGDPKRDRLSIRDKVFSFSGPKPTDILSGRPKPNAPYPFVAGVNADFRSRYPTAPVTEAVYCRESLTSVETGNRIVDHN
jgi:hypothetical protein